jgi:acyl-coenzyme A thioesterase PaaI-like protein
LTSEIRIGSALKRDRQGAFEFEPHRCFACGELNEHGLQLQLHTNPEGSWTELTLDPRFQGWDAVAHGGIVCTILDEVMAWSVIGRGTWGVTARLNVAFRRPISTGRPIRAEGWVVEEHRRAYRTAGRVLDAMSGDVIATAEGTFMAVPHDQLERLKSRYGMRRIPDASAQEAPDTTGTVADASVARDMAAVEKVVDDTERGERVAGARSRASAAPAVGAGARAT